MTTDITSLEIGSARKRALFSVSLNLALAVVKGIFGLMAASTALIGDALHSATDVFASGAAFVGLWLAGKRHPSFPFGLYKAENIATLVISVFIMLVAYEIGRGAILGPKRMPDVALALPVAAVTFVVALAFGLYQLRWGRRLGSPSLVADARDYLADSLSTGLVILGLAAESLGIPLERFAAFGVALFVFWSGGRIMVGSLRDLLDAAIDPGMQKDITTLVSRHPQVKSVERLIGRTAGSRILLNLDVLLRTESHEVADKIADRLEEEPEVHPLELAPGVEVRCHTGHRVAVDATHADRLPAGLEQRHPGAALVERLEQRL